MPRRSTTCLLLATLLLAPSAWPAESDSVAQAIAKPNRLDQDIARDQRSKPAAILPLLNLEPGDRVADIFGSGGYYSELISSIVGPRGEVLLHNNQGFRAWGINILNDRFGDRPLANVTQHDREIADLDLGTNELNAALLVMAYHDMYVIPKRYNGEKYVPVGKPADVDHFMQQIFEGLKPGARFVVIDHSGDAEQSLDEVLELHRIHESFAHNSIEGYGFEFLQSSDVLRNPNDDRSMIVFDSDIQGRSDRFVLVFEKPGN